MDYFSHGGDVYRNPVQYDFSININPFGLPEEVRTAITSDLSYATRYPDPECMQLRECLSKSEQIPSEQIICGNGASELIVAVIRAIKPQKALVLAPTFSGYEKALASIKVVPERYTLLEEYDYCIQADILEKLKEDLDLFFLCNPNNPVGNCLEESLLFQIVERCKEKKIMLVIDECFLPFHEHFPDNSMVSELEQNPWIFILRAFTKLYAMPGIRLGYGISSNKELLAEMKNQIPEWSVSGLAQAAGIAALSSKHYVEASKIYIKKEREWMEIELKNLGLKVYPSEADYLFFECEKGLFEVLLTHKILIRSCSNYIGLSENHYRIAVKTREENQVLIAALQSILSAGKEE